MLNVDQIWQTQLQNRFSSGESLESFFKITAEEKNLCSNFENLQIPRCLITPFFAMHMKALRDTGRFSDFEALRKQVIPSVKETEFSENETEDPLGARFHQKMPRLIHQYNNRVLILATDRCISHCRHCFRRNFVQNNSGFIHSNSLFNICSYLKSNPQVEEVLISGGDILLENDEKLTWLLEQIRGARPDILIRLCTRAHVFLPQRFTGNMLAILKKFRPLWVISHINHPAELSTEAKKAILATIDGGIPIQSQTVLLKGVNDKAEILSELFNTLVKLSVKPGYLFQADLALGTKHFRVPLKKALFLFKDLQQMLSGLSLPRFAVDLPNGGGKFNLEQLIQTKKVKKTSDEFIFYTRDGDEYIYPAD